MWNHGIATPSERFRRAACSASSLHQSRTRCSWGKPLDLLPVCVRQIFVVIRRDHEQ